jgi:potassium efflux system protein
MPSDDSGGIGVRKHAYYSIQSGMRQNTTDSTLASEFDPEMVSEPLIPDWNQNEGILTNIYSIGEHIWNFSIPVGNATIHVNQIITALIAFCVGLIVSKFIARRVGGNVLPRMKVEPGPASAIQTIVYYLLLIATVLVALEIANVPLTIFTIFGGALALGIGFGSQNIMNNFISGLILLLERPIQVGDLVTIDDDSGIVIKIGPRATHVQSYNGVTNIVPNSTLLENAVANWNLPDRKVRAEIAVGVAYGSDTAKVKTILEDILKEHIRVLESTENRILFTNFGDSSLDFEAHFWISPRSVLDRQQIESDIRFKIDQAFREHNISIPFPQRDMHVFNHTDGPGIAAD